ncbi:uncharacterized protein [Typha latifolia]|uniref:uncharacterized protein n=1 Tax=Typha latifolia TaxID=4733 RepID=UPI003C2B82A6
MGACVSKSSSMQRPPKDSFRTRKQRGKKQSSIPDGPKPQIRDAGNRFPDFSLSEFVHVETAATSHRKAELSNLTLHLTQMQWHHSQMDAHGLCQEDAWFDSVSVLESDSDDEFSSVLEDTIESQMIQYQNASRVVDAMCKLEEFRNGAPIHTTGR